MKNNLYLFDLDGTLYEKSNPITNELRKNCILKIRQNYSCSIDKAEEMYFGLCKSYPNPYKGLASLGITPCEYMSFFNKLPVERYIEKDDRLLQFLQDISGKKKIVTFSPFDYAYRVLKSLGVVHCFDEIVCMNDFFDYEKKNYYETICCNEYDSIYVFGDDYVNDILPALKKGYICFFITEKQLKNVTCKKKIVDCILM